MTVSELSRELKLPRPTVYDNLSTLRGMGLVLKQGNQWLCQPMFLGDEMSDLIIPAYQVLVLSIIEKMVLEPGVDPVNVTRGALAALTHLFEIGARPELSARPDSRLNTLEPVSGLR